MSILLKIASQNIMANRKRTVFIGLSIFFASFLLFILSSAINGAETQILKSYINLQSGNVAIVWKGLKEISNMEPGRLMDGENSFDIKEDSLNKQAITRLISYIEKHRDEIKYYFPTIRSYAKIFAKGDLDYINIYSISPENRDFLITSGTIQIEQGSLPPNDDYGICISRERADKYGIKLGDLVSIEVTSPHGAKNILDFVVTGIYANGAGYDNWYGYISYENAKVLYDFDEGYFDIGRIYLKNPGDFSKFAKELDMYLLEGSDVLRAESSAEASYFYTNNSRNFKILCNLLIMLLLIVIAIGLRATIKMNLFERMKEFGTLRAIGYSRIQNYAIIFFELLFLSLIFSVFAFVISSIIVIIFGNVGIYVGPGSMSYAFGGEYLYPEIRISDLILTIVIMVIFSIVSTFNPGMKICYQNITDLLHRKQQKIFLIGILFKKTFGFTPLKSSRRGA